MTDTYDRPGSSYDRDGGDQDPNVGHDGPAAGKKSDPRSEYNPQSSPMSDSSDPRRGLKDAEESPKPTDGDWDGGYFNKDDTRRFLSRLRKNGRGSLSRRKFISIIISILSGGAISISAFLFLGIFDLPNFMKNVEQAGFQRYQVDINGRSSKWLEAYMELRFGEIDDPNLAPKDRNNVFFRANRVDTNRPMTDWYRTMRSSKFEQELFESKGIRFTSMGYEKNGSIRYRPGVISFKNTDKRITFDPGQRTFDALARGDPNAFNGALQDFVQKEKEFDTDKEARAFLKATLKEHYPQWWKAVKRFHLRHDIQNMIGVRNWKFFETKRNNLNEKKISIRNKIITSALPEDSKSGAFIKCLFGIPDCGTSSDPGNPKANELAPTGEKKDGNKTDGNRDNPQPLVPDTADAALQAGSDANAATAAAGKTANKIASKLIDKANTLSLIDSLARFDKAIHNHSLSKLVTQARSAQYEGLFTVFEVAGDQLTTGQLTSSEVKEFMSKFAHVTNNEGWTSVINPASSSGKVSADSTNYVKAKDKQQFCSQAHQDEMQKYPEKANLEYQYNCPDKQISGPNQAHDLEDDWNGGAGGLLHPILDAFENVFGGVFDVFNSVTGAITGKLIDASLAVTGTTDDVAKVVATVAQAAMNFGGANIGMDDNTPDGQVAMGVFQGAAATGEATTRDQGAASTTPGTMTLANKNILAYQIDQEHTSFVNRYLSLSNPKSLLATQLFALSNARFSSPGQDILDIFGSALSSPWRVLSQPAHAAVPDGYAAAKFAGIETFDFPKECLDSSPLSMTPRSATNADELGLFKPDELNWDLMSNKEDWYKALYDKVGDNEDLAKKVWNCALFDNTVRGGIGAKYGYAGEDAFESGNSPQTPVSSVSGDAQQVAQDILANKNITYIFSAHDDVALAAQGKPGTNGAPISIQALQIVAALGEKHQVIVSAYESYGQGHSTGSDHYSGHAVDIANIDGKIAYENITDFYSEFSQYAKGAVFLQGNCPGAKPAPTGMDRQPGDACNHQHISVP